MFEETKIKVDDRLKFITTFYVKYPKKDFLYHQHRIVLDEFPEVIVNKDEHKGFVWVTPDEALALPLIHDEEYCIEYVYKR